MGSAAQAVALRFLVAGRRGLWPVRVLSGLFLPSVGWSRVYLGVRFPTNVLADWVGSVDWVGGLHLLFFSCRSELRDWGGQVAQVWRLWSHSRGLDRLMPAILAGAATRLGRYDKNHVLQPVASWQRVRPVQNFTAVRNPTGPLATTNGHFHGIPGPTLRAGSLLGCRT